MRVGADPGSPERGNLEERRWERPRPPSFCHLFARSLERCATTCTETLATPPRSAGSPAECVWAEPDRLRSPRRAGIAARPPIENRPICAHTFGLVTAEWAGGKRR